MQMIQHGSCSGSLRLLTLIIPTPKHHVRLGLLSCYWIDGRLAFNILFQLLGNE